MRLSNSSKLIQPIDATDGEMFIIMDESTGNEIEFTIPQLVDLHDAIATMINIPSEARGRNHA